MSLGFWLNIGFVVNCGGAFRSIVAIAIDVLTSEDRYFLWITAVPLPRRCLQSRHSGSRMRGVALALSGRPICDPIRIIATCFSHSSVNPLRLQNFQLECIYYLRRIMIFWPPRVFWRLKRRSSIFIFYSFFDAFPPKVTLGPCQGVGVVVGVEDVHLWAWTQGQKVTFSRPISDEQWAKIWRTQSGNVTYGPKCNIGVE